MLDQITPLILTYDEAPNIERTLGKLRWARRIVVVDSGSTDGTLEILKRHERVEVFQRRFTDFESQWNFGLSQIASPWVLSLDADYELGDDVIRELESLSPSSATKGYRAEFIYRIQGRPLRGSLYPPRVVLFRRGEATYRQEGHTQQLAIAGEVLSLRGRIYHDDRKPLARWVRSQQRYAREEAEYLATRRSLGAADRLRRMAWPAPVAVLLYTLLVKRCLFDGWPGWYYALQRLIAEILLALEILDRRLRGGSEGAARSIGAPR